MEDWQTRLNELMAEAHEHATSAVEASNAGKNHQVYYHLSGIRRVGRLAQELLL